MTAVAREPGVQPAGAAVTPDRKGASVCYVVRGHGSEEIRFDRDTAERLLAAGDFFWLDLDQPTRR